METAKLTVDRAEALEMWKKYQSHKHTLGAGKAVDREIERIYYQIARGKVVIKALESIVNAGLGEDTLPKLAIVRADAKECYLRTYMQGSASMCDMVSPRANAASDRLFSFPQGSFPGIGEKVHRWTHAAIVPLIPPDLRPRRGLQNYHILFEAEWTRKIPIDPLLLRRIGKGDTWLVCGAWELTEVERAVLQSRLTN